MARLPEPGENNYQQKKAIYDILRQVFEDFKYDKVHGGHTWNTPVEQIQGITMRMLGESQVELTYHHYEVTTIEGINRADDNGKEFLDAVVKQLKSRFKRETGTALTLKPVKSDRNLEKVSRLSAESSWMLGSNRYGHGARPVGRYLIRDVCLYDLHADL